MNVGIAYSDEAHAGCIGRIPITHSYKGTLHVKENIQYLLLSRHIHYIHYIYAKFDYSYLL